MGGDGECLARKDKQIYNVGSISRAKMEQLFSSIVQSPCFPFERLSMPPILSVVQPLLQNITNMTGFIMTL